MMWTIAVILALLWACGLAFSYTWGGYIHLLAVAAGLIVIRNMRSSRQVNSLKKPRNHKRWIQ
jgi:hypothetical protein